MLTVLFGWSAPLASAEPPSLVAKVDWPLFLGGGGGGSVGLAQDRWEAGVMGFATPLSPGLRDRFLVGADGAEVFNWGAEVYAQWFPREDRRWFFVGGLVSVDGFDLDTGEAATSFYSLYVVPRAGVRVPIIRDLLFFEPSMAFAVPLWQSSTTLGGSAVHAQPIAPIPFASIGGSFPVGRRSRSSSASAPSGARAR